MGTAEDLKQAEALVKALKKKKKQEAEKLTRWLDFRYFIDHVSNSPEKYKKIRYIRSEKLVVCSASGSHHYWYPFGSLAGDTKPKKRKTRWVDQFGNIQVGTVLDTMSFSGGFDDERRFDSLCIDAKNRFRVLELMDLKSPLSEAESIQDGFGILGIFVHFKIDSILDAKTVKKRIIVDTSKYHSPFQRHTYQGKFQRTRKDDLDKGYVLTVTFQYESHPAIRPLISLLKRSNFSRVNDELVQGRLYEKMHTVHAFLKNENPQDTEAKEILLQLCKLFTSRDFSKRWTRHKSHYNPVLEFPAKVESERIKKERDTPPKKENTLRGRDPQERSRVSAMIGKRKVTEGVGVGKEAIDETFAVYNKAKKKAKEAKKKKKKIKKFEKLTK